MSLSNRELKRRIAVLADSYKKKVEIINDQKRVIIMLASKVYKQNPYDDIFKLFNEEHMNIIKSFDDGIVECDIMSFKNEPSGYYIVDFGIKKLKIPNRSPSILTNDDVIRILKFSKTINDEEAKLYKGMSYYQT